MDPASKSMMGTSNFGVNHSLPFSSSSSSSSLADANISLLSNGSQLNYAPTSSSSHHYNYPLQSQTQFNLNTSYPLFNSSNESADKKDNMNSRSNSSSSSSANCISSNHLNDTSLKVTPPSTLSSANSFNSQLPASTAGTYNHNLDNYYYSSQIQHQQQLQQRAPLDFASTSLRTMQTMSTYENDRAANENNRMTLNPENSLNEPTHFDVKSSSTAIYNSYSKPASSESLTTNFNPSYPSALALTTPSSPFAYGSASSAASSATDQNQTLDKSKGVYIFSNQYPNDTSSLSGDPVYSNQPKMNYSNASLSETQQSASSSNETAPKSTSSYSSPTISQHQSYARSTNVYSWSTNNIMFNNQNYDLNSSYYQLPQSFNAASIKSYQGYTQTDFGRLDGDNLNIFYNGYNQTYNPSTVKTETTLNTTFAPSFSVPVTTSI